MSQELQLIFEAKISLNEVTKHISFPKRIHLLVMMTWQQNFISTSQMNYLLSFYPYLHNSWEKNNTIGASSRTEIISVIYLSYIIKEIKKKKDLEPVSLLNVDFKIYTTILENRMQKPLVAIIGEIHQPAFKNITILNRLLLFLI